MPDMYCMTHGSLPLADCMHHGKQLSLQGREQEITLSDLVHVAEEQQHAWFQDRPNCQVSQPCQLHSVLEATLHGSPTCVWRCIMAFDAWHNVYVCSFIADGLLLAKRTECWIDG